jgi:F-type H+-transporting ATPase subunit b
MELVTPGLGLLIWNTLTFLVVLFILSKFAWKPIVKAIKEREKTIEDALEAANKAKQEIAFLKAENEKIIQEARIEREKILKEAQQTAHHIVEEAKEKAKREAQRIIESAKASIENDRKALMVEVKNYAATLSIEIAEKILKKSLSNASEHHSLITEYLKETNLN